MSYARRAVRWSSTRPGAPPVAAHTCAGRGLLVRRRQAPRPRACARGAVPDDLAAQLAAGPDALGSTTETQPPAPRPPRRAGTDTTLKEERMARSRSGTRGRRGPRKPPREPVPRRARSRSSTRASVARSSCPGTITVKELAELLTVSAGDIIRELIKSGIFATINQLIDRDTASLVAEELGYEVAEATRWPRTPPRARAGRPPRPPRRSCSRRTTRPTWSPAPRS